METLATIILSGLRPELVNLTAGRDGKQTWCKHMTTFVIERCRDAWFVIRGYKYQIDLTILRWLSITNTQTLLLEFGEDIDIINNAMVKELGNFDRELEQIKHLDKPITLRSPACKAALANAIQHFAANPSQKLIFRFCTNSSITTERPSAFDDRKSGIVIWESLRKNAIAEPDRTAKLNGLLTFLRGLEKPSKGIDDNTWSVFTTFMVKASLDELASFIERFEWSTQQLKAGDVSKEILRLLQDRVSVGLTKAKVLYPRLFLHVIQLLSQPGEKILNTSLLNKVLALPTLSERDSRLLKFISSEVISHAERLEQLELAAQRHEIAISDIRQQMLEVQFGPNASVTLATAITDISTTLPPQVGSIAKRSDVVSAIVQEISNHDWFAIYGSIGCGKTQLATLIGDQLDSIIYVSLRDLTSAEANFLLHHLFMQLCDNNQTGSVTNSGLTALAPGTAVFLDDVPRLVAGDQLSQRLIRIADSVCARNQTLITLSHHPIPRDVVSSLRHRRRFSETLAPPMVLNDVKELFEKHGAPEDVITSHITESFILSTSGNPTLLSAIARSIAAKGWHHIEEHRLQIAQMASAGEIATETMFRLLTTVEKETSRELLYRLCVVTGAFGAREIDAVSMVDPPLQKANESYVSLQGLWVEQQTDDLSAVCPLISQFGTKELDKDVECGVANALAMSIFENATISPIEFAKAINYLKRAKNGPSLGMHLLSGLEYVDDAPIAWKKLIFFITVAEGILDECPTVLSLLIKAKQLKLAQSIGAPISGLVTEANRLIEMAAENELWAVFGYASQAAPIVAKEDLDEALRLCRLALGSFEEVIHYRNEFVGEAEDQDGSIVVEFEGSFPWFFVSELKYADDFMKWFDVISNQPKARVEKIFQSDLGREGFKIALDHLWMIQHELPEDERKYDSILAAYDTVIAFCEANNLRLFHALAVRAQIIVYSEYLKDLQKAVELADAFLNGVEHTDEIVFLICEAIGRQHLYAKQNREAIKKLTRACRLDTGTFDGLRCRAFIELSRAIGDEDCGKALSLAENSIVIARRNPRDVSVLEMVSSLGEAAIAAGFDRKYDRAFDYIEEAFLLMSHEFVETIDWKMRFVFLGNALGYFAAMASTGKAPASDYTIPPRGHLISYNEAAAGWYDKANYKAFDMAPTLMVMFANAVGRDDRAVFWANKGIDDARAKGVLVCIYPLGEVLIPNMIMQNEFDKALDYAFESSTALVASAVAHRTAMPDIRERQDAFELLGAKPNEDWRQAEQLYLLIGVIPSILFCCVHEEGRSEKLQHLASHCSAKVKDASNADQFSVISDAIAFFLTKGSSVELHTSALRDNDRDNPAGRATKYLLSSFSEDADIKLAIVQHALVMEYYSTKFSGRSILWKFLTDQLTVFWRQAFEKGRFRFSSPALIEDTFQNLDQVEPEKRIKRMIQSIFSGLSVRLPTQLKSTSEWLHN